MAVSLSLKLRLLSLDNMLSGLLDRSSTEDVLHKLEQVAAKLNDKDLELQQVTGELFRIQSGLEKQIDERTTELAIARDQALESSRTKSAFLANMSHELRTPLNAILGYSEILQEEAENQELAGDLGKIRKAGTHLLDLISDILDLSKIEAGSMELDLDQLDVKTLLQEVMFNCQPLVEKNRNRLISALDEDLGSIYSDSRKIYKTVFCLMANAAKFTRDGEIVLKATREPLDEQSMLQIAVTDTGIGIGPEKIGALFKAFSQADVSTTRKYGGTGLGLTIAKRYCEMLGGDLKVETTSHGTMFVVTLPERSLDRRVEPEQNELPGKAIDRRSHMASVLIVDGERDSLQLLPELLQKSGFNVTSAQTGKKGLLLARQIQPDVIILDPQMASQDGWDCLRELMIDEAVKQIPVIVLSRSQDKNRARALGASFCLEKPVDHVQLDQAVKECVRKQHRPLFSTSQGALKQ